MNINLIIQDCGLDISHHHTVPGGDINEAFCLFANEKKYFLKVNSDRLFPGMFQKEAAGLDILNENTSLAVPLVIKSGLVNEQQYLLLEWLEKGIPKQDCMEKFGADLALMHRQTQTAFGLIEDNYIGRLPQKNTLHASWENFYSECRIHPLAKKLFDSGSFSNNDLLLVDQLCKKLNSLFPEEPPALLHGDLWSGNFMITSSGYVAIYDPAVYYGHREMDIAMTKLFGGFDQRFYDAYRETYPLQAGWEKRLSLAQLYPVVVHAVLFGGHYIGHAREIIKQFS